MTIQHSDFEEFYAAKQQIEDEEKVNRWNALQKWHSNKYEKNK